MGWVGVGRYGPSGRPATLLRAGKRAATLLHAGVQYRVDGIWALALPIKHPEYYFFVVYIIKYYEINVVPKPVLSRILVGPPNLQVHCHLRRVLVCPHTLKLLMWL